MTERPTTPEEQRWLAHAHDPERAQRMLKYQYILLGVWIVLTVVYLAIVPRIDGGWRWWNGAVLLVGYVNLGIGIVHTRRIAAGSAQAKKNANSK